MNFPRWLRHAWLIGFPLIAIALASYASSSNCADIADAAARAACAESSGQIVFGMTLGLLFVVWLVAPLVLGALSFVASRLVGSPPATPIARGGSGSPGGRTGG